MYGVIPPDTADVVSTTCWPTSAFAVLGDGAIGTESGTIEVVVDVELVEVEVDVDVVLDVVDVVVGALATVTVLGRELNVNGDDALSIPMTL